MQILNKTTVTLQLENQKLQPNDADRFFESGVYSYYAIKSDIGSCVIISEGFRRKIKCFGRLKAKELKGPDAPIVIFQKR